jgi:RNA polymerase sigma-70 factor (ECF subfamily)
MPVTGESHSRESLSADLRLVATGDRRAFERVYERTCAKLMGICLGVVGERAAAEDVLQEVYVIVWRQAARFDPARASPITWLGMIARNRAIDWRRAHERRADRFGHTLPPFIADESVPVDQAMAAAQVEQRAVLCLDRLNQDQREAIRDAFLGGHTYLALAEKWAVPLGTIKSRIRRGLIELKKCMADD